MVPWSRDLTIASRQVEDALAPVRCCPSGHVCRIIGTDGKRKWAQLRLIRRCQPCPGTREFPCSQDNNPARRESFFAHKWKLFRIVVFQIPILGLMYPLIIHLTSWSALARSSSPGVIRHPRPDHRSFGSAVVFIGYWQVTRSLAGRDRNPVEMDTLQGAKSFATHEQR